MMKSEPDNKYSTHQVILTHQGVSLGLLTCDYRGEPAVNKIDIDPIPSNAIKTYSGMQQYADMVPPWTPVAQSDFSGGMGNEDFDLDRMRYFDGFRVDSLSTGKLTGGPASHYASGHRLQDMYWPKHDKGIALTYIKSEIYDTKAYIATKFVATGSYSAVSVNLMCGYTRAGTEQPYLNVAIYGDSGGSPTGIPLSSGNLDFNNYEPDVIKERKVTLGAATGLTAGTTYHLVVKGYNDVTEDSHWFVISSKNTTISKYSSDGSTWINGSDAVFFRVAVAENTLRGWFGELKGSFYCGVTYDDGTVSKVYINGDQGVADGGGATSLVDSTKSWLTNMWQGAIAVFRVGPGSTADVNYRTITGNNGDTLNFAAAQIAVGAGTEYSIVGTDIFSVIAANPMTGSITDLLDKHDMLYFAMGGSEVIRRLRAYDSSGTWTEQWANETAYARLLQDSGDAGGAHIWKANEAAQIAKAPAINGAGSGAAAALTFAANISAGDLSERINGLTVYGDNGYLYVLKEGGLYAVVSDVPYRIPVYGMESTKDRRNGLSHAAMGQYLYFNWHDQLMRYYVNDLKSIFPEGLPEGRYSIVSDMAVYTDRLYVAMDGGTGGYSSILAYNGLGMCEIYRAPAAGLRIRGMKIQSIPGNAVDRLWFTCGSDIVWLPVVYDPIKHPQTPYQFYDFNYESHLVTSWLYMGMWDLYKLFYSLKLVSEKSSGTSSYCVVDYQIDGDTDNLEDDWISIGSFSDDIVIKRVLSSDFDVAGRRIRFRFRIISVNNADPIKIVGYVCEAMMKTPVINTFQVTFKVEDMARDAMGVADTYGTVEYVTGLLATWSASPYPARVESVVSELHEKWVMIEPTTIRILDVIEEEGRQIYICNVRLVEVGSNV